MNKKQAFALILALLLFALVIAYVSIKPKEYHSTTVTDALDTVSQLSVYSSDDKALTYCVDYMKSMSGELSCHDSSSNIYKFNQGIDVDFSEDAKELIKIGDEFTNRYPDYFSIYLEPLSKGWDIPNNSGTIPDVTALLEKSNEKKTIDLGGIAKGYITDKLIENLKEMDIDSAILNLGGNTYALGKKQNGDSWKVGISDPKDSNSLIGILLCTDVAVVTSGDYQRYFDISGVRYHHILDPKTGYPANSGLHSVTVISESATIADILSTTVFVSGMEKGIEILKEHNALGIFVTNDKVYYSPELADALTSKDAKYEYISL